MDYFQHLTEEQIKTIIAASDAARVEFYAKLAILKKAGIDEGHAWTYRTPTPALDELDRVVAALSPDARHELAGLMWLGRGDDMGDHLVDAIGGELQR